MRLASDIVQPLILFSKVADAENSVTILVSNGVVLLFMLTLCGGQRTGGLIEALTIRT
jgi:hypothetical protein